MIRLNVSRPASAGRVFALLCTLLLGLEVANAQNQNITLPAGELSAGEVIRQIEHQTDFVVGYNSAVFGTGYPVNSVGGEKPLKDLLELMLSGTNFGYVIEGSFILINPKPIPAVQPLKPDLPVPAEGYEPTHIRDISTAPRPRPVREAADPDSIPSIAADPVIVPEPYSDYTSLDKRNLLATAQSSYALKMNLLYGAATLTPNIGFELGLGERSSLDFSASFNPWNRKGSLADNQKISHAILRGEYRWWMCERFNGHFLGAHAYYTNFNISGYKLPLLNFKKENRYEGLGFGAGFTYGYHLPLSTRWGLEFNVGVGAAWLKYDRYDCQVCSDVEENKTRFYFGPTRAGITLVFMIK